MSTTQSNGDAPTLGDLVEEWACERFDMEYVDEPHYDALDDDTKVEVKGAQVWIQNGYKNGKPMRTRGRWKFWKASHADLIADDGDYLLVVYEEDDGDITALAHQRVKAATITEYVGDCWYDVRSNPRTASKGNPYRLSWAKVFDHDEVT